MDQMILFGDSLTQFSGDQSNGFAFKATLEDAYIRKLDVVNRGFSGYNSDLALRVLPHIIPPPTTASRIRLFTIFLGANDARLPDTPPLSQSVSPAQYRANLRSIIQHPSLKAHSPDFLLITPPPIDERLCEIADEQKGFGGTVRRTAEHTRLYAEIVRELGAELDVPVVDLWDAFMRRAGWEGEDQLPGSKKLLENAALRGLLKDGLHLTGEAYRVMYEELMTTIRAKLPHLVPERLEMVFPDWKDEEAWVDFQGPRHASRGQ